MVLNSEHFLYSVVLNTSVPYFTLNIVDSAHLESELKLPILLLPSDMLLGLSLGFVVIITKFSF